MKIKKPRRRATWTLFVPLLRTSYSAVLHEILNFIRQELSCLEVEVDSMDYDAFADAGEKSADFRLIRVVETEKGAKLLSGNGVFEHTAPAQLAVDDPAELISFLSGFLDHAMADDDPDELFFAGQGAQAATFSRLAFALLLDSETDFEVGLFAVSGLAGNELAVVGREWNWQFLHKFLKGWSHATLTKHDFWRKF